MKSLKSPVKFLSILISLYILVHGGDSITVTEIPVSGEITPIKASFIKRSIAKAKGNNSDLILFNMDTFGGSVDAAYEIVDTITSTKIKTIAYVDKKAISAGALLALSCDLLVMAPHTTIGDVAPISMSQEGPKMLGEKFQSPLRAKFRSLAKKNGYPPLLAESMVSAELTAFEVVLQDTVLYTDSTGLKRLQEENDIQNLRLIVKNGELLTMDNTEAQDLGFSMMTAENTEEALKGTVDKDYRIIRTEINWSETMASFISKIAPILMMLGLGALYTEIKAPGFGIPGATGLVLISLVLFSQYISGLADYTEILIISLGIILLAAEVFLIPGFGVAGITGLSLMLIGLVLSFQGFVIPDPEMPWQLGILIKNIQKAFAGLAGSFVIAFLLIKYLLPGTGGMIPGITLTSSLKRGSSSTSDQDKENTLIGKPGTVVKALRPSGMVKIEGRVLDAVSEGDYIDKDERIRVIGQTPFKVTVKGIKGDE